MTIKLCGFSLSNYYNKVKLVLLEKGIPFEEELVMTHSHDEAVLSCTPLGKVPFIRTPQGALCESQVILDYLEAAYPQPALLPADPFQAAKQRELISFIELHLELVARELYAQAFFGGTVSEGTQARVRKQLSKNIAGFKRLAKFAPYVGGDSFGMADCAAWVSLPLVAQASKLVLGEDMLAAAGVDWKSYAKLVGERPMAQKVAADRKADQERIAALKAQAS
ncbi:glutathione S-transferase family protein [Paucibacter sp. KCTC 42545]|uniref:glutathione S-transferase family protein n=1 Tax=Paucibacter sp. KCTC 42545 TaxID=1768242 RepID=UPI000733A38F|nr:glutathione S-transferase [Paucibacter sp. KCTC 42545]ALT78562.1 glutathione S-transferase [Paucibacter sp. KCTC 42545]